MDAARLLIAGDVDGALIAAEPLRRARNDTVRRDGHAVLAWVHLVRGERDRAEAAASLSRNVRAPDPLLTVALVVAAGGPSEGAAVAFTETQGVTSLVAATRVFADDGVLADVRAEIAKLPPKKEQVALENLQIGLVALGFRADVDEVAGRLTELGRTADRDAVFASVLGELGITELALRYLRLAGDHGFADLDRLMEDPALAQARAHPAFAAVRDRIDANARAAAADTGP
jgi:hypothetical protein